MNLHRIWEKLTGQPHQQNDVAHVLAEARELRSLTAELHSTLKSYEKNPDAFVSIFADAYNKNQVANIWKGPEA